MKKFFPAILLFFLCAATFFNGYHNGFLLDDYTVLLGQKSFPLTDYLQLSRHSFQKYIYFRPITHAILIPEYWLFGNKPEGYFICNFILFWLCAVSLLKLFQNMFGDRQLACLTAALFCVHPINGICVNYKNATGYPFMILCMNLGLLASLKFEEKKGNFFRGASMILFVLALGCHEIAAALPFYMWAMFYFGRGNSATEALKKCLPFFGILAMYAVFRVFCMSLAQTIFISVGRIDFDLVGYMAELSRLAAWYLQKLVLLKGIVLIWDGGGAIRNPGLWILGLGGVICIAFYLMFRVLSGRKEAVLISWILIGFLPVSFASLTRPTFHYYIEPHWLFYSSIGFLGLIAVVLLKIKRYLNRLIWFSLTGIILMFNMLVSIENNYLWGNQKRYCLYWKDIAPRNYWVRHWLGLTYLAERNYSAAKDNFEMMLKQGLTKPDVYGNLAISEYYLGHIDRSQELFNQVLELKPGDDKALRYKNKIRKILDHAGNPDQ